MGSVMSSQASGEFRYSSTASNGSAVTTQKNVNFTMPTGFTTKVEARVFLCKKCVGIVRKAFSPQTIVDVLYDSQARIPVLHLQNKDGTQYCKITCKEGCADYIRTAFLDEEKFYSKEKVHSEEKFYSEEKVHSKEEVHPLGSIWINYESHIEEKANIVGTLDRPSTLGEKAGQILFAAGMAVLSILVVGGLVIAGLFLGVIMIPVIITLGLLLLVLATYSALASFFTEPALKMD